MARETLNKSCDVLVVGGGIAAAFAAIRAREAGAEVIMVDKGFVGKSGCSAFAAGVLRNVMYPEDDLNTRVKEEIEFSQYLYMQDRVKEHYESVWEVINELDRYGAGFLKTGEGKFERTAGRGHWPLLMFPGNSLMDSLRKAAAKKGIQLVNKTMITDLLTWDGRVVGATGFNTVNGDFNIFRAKATVIATGETHFKGLGAGHRTCTGDGFVAAYRVGAILSGAESEDRQGNAFPAHYDIGPGMNMFMGQGGKLINAKGETFMEKYDPELRERTRLLTLTKALAMEARQGNTPIYVDMTHFSPAQVKKLRVVLPLPMRKWERVGILVGDRITRPVEWMLKSPYGRPGIKVTSRGESSLPGLYAVGEAAATQAYACGLAPCATQGASAGKYAAEYSKGIDDPDIAQSQVEEHKERVFAPVQRKDGIEPDQVRLAVQELITPYDVYYLRHEKRMLKALEELEDIKQCQVPLLCAYDPHYLRMAHEASNLVFVAEACLRSAIFRKESRLGLREDYPFQDNVNWLKWTELRREGDRMAISASDVPIDSYPFKPEKREKFLHPLWARAAGHGIVRIEKGEVRWE